MAEPEGRGLAQPLLQAGPGQPTANTCPTGDLESAAAVRPRPAVWQSSSMDPAAWRGVQAVIEESLAPRFRQSSLWDTTINLTNAILGAGMLSLPHAWAGLGLLGGAAMTAAVAVLTYASVCVLLRSSERTGKLTYAALMEAEWERWAGVAVRLSIILGSAGFLVLYLIILADLLVGSEQWSGIIPDLWPQLPDPLPWYLGRSAVLTWVTLLVAPALSPQTLGDVAVISVMKVLCSVLCVGALVVLAVVLAVQVRLPEVRWLPDPAFFGEGLLARLSNVLAIVPVMMTAYLCHMSLHPLVQDLHSYTPRRMRRAVAWSMLICGLTYATIGAAGLLVFGQGVKGDVLANLSIDGVADILGGRLPLAMAFVATVKVAMALSLIMSFPVTIWPMRQDFIEMLAPYLGSTQLSPAGYYCLTYVFLLLIYVLALAIQSAYQVVGLVGATTGVSLAFVAPGMLAMRDAQGGPAYRAFGWLLLLLGSLLMVIGMASTSAEEG